MGLFKKKIQKKVCVIGLDGVPFGLLSDLAARDVMPNFASLIESGHLHRMKASLPEISSVSWTDFMTGTNAGTHGIFGFTDFKPGTLDLRFPNFLDNKTETFWDELGRRKKRSIIINQPSTYPARKIPGILISGFVAIDLAKAVFPLPYKQQLDKIDYQIDIDTFRAREDHGILWKELDSTLKSRVRALKGLWNEDWDYFEFVITGTDRLMHFLWDAYPDESHPHHQRFLDYYHNVDSVVGGIIADFRKITGGDEGLFLLSDHGFTGIIQEVYLNVWLQQQGYLSYKTPNPAGISDITPESRAFVMDPNRIYLNLEGKFPQGSVKESEKEALKQEISSKLQGLEYEGKKIVHKVFDTSKVYTGPQIDRGPDLIAVSEHGFDIKGSVKKSEVFGLSNLKGMHTWDDAFFWADRDRGSELKISDLSSFILEYFS